MDATVEFLLISFKAKLLLALINLLHVVHERLLFFCHSSPLCDN